jgi:hypothetical protein
MKSHLDLYGANVGVWLKRLIILRIVIPYYTATGDV